MRTQVVPTEPGLDLRRFAVIRWWTGGKARVSGCRGTNSPRVGPLVLADRSDDERCAVRGRLRWSRRFPL